MGIGFTSELAADVAEGDMGRRVALVLHVTTNFYPALPAAYAGVADAALDAAGFGNWDAVIPLPSGLAVIPARRWLTETDAGQLGITAQTAIEILRLHPFVESWDA